MTNKHKIELEYLLKTSPRVLETMLTTESGLTDWFVENLKIKEDIYCFEWEGEDPQYAKLMHRKNGESIRWKWLNEDKEIDAEDPSYFELWFKVDPMTQTVVLKVTDFAEDVEYVTSLWENSINDLKRVLGA
jgi:hypothetical protein